MSRHDNTLDEHVRDAQHGRTRDSIPQNAVVTPMWGTEQPPDCIACDVDGDRWLWYSPVAFSTFCHNQPKHHKVLKNPRSTYRPGSPYQIMFEYVTAENFQMDEDKRPHLAEELRRKLHRSNHIFQ